MPPLHPLTLPGTQTDDGVILAGWALKKRRKKMQGFARRYFTLFSSGVLSYAFEPGRPARDQILLTQAAITTAPGRKDIHIDSSNATFHIKCLSGEDFNKWISAIRKYITQDAVPSGRKSSISRSLPRAGHFNRAGTLVDELGNTIDELQNAFAALSDDETRKKPTNTAKLKSEKDKVKDHAKEYSGPVRSLFKHRKSNTTEHELNADPPSSQNSFVRMQVALEALKYQHSALVQSFAALTHVDQGSSLRASLPTAKEEEEMHTPSTGFSTLGRASQRLSSQSESSVWFDAPEYDGAEEFVMDEPEEDSNLKSSDAESDLGREESHTQPTDDLEVELTTDQTVTHRTQLPSPPVGDEGSLFAVLKKNVGKDLAQVALPVSFNEPLTLLQRIAEELEYHDLLSEAVRCQDPTERLCYVAAFAVSAYASTKYRSGRKGFNPMLGETFEDPRLHFLAEKVCHNPVVLAYHAEGEGWKLHATSSGKTKFWGKSLEIIPQGTTHLLIADDHYEWTRPSSFMRNLMMGTKYLEHTGKMVVQNRSTGARCILEFKESGYWGIPNQVAGTVISPAGHTVTHLEGKWDEQISQKLDASHLRVLWRMAPFPRDAPEYYGFTSFGITLNEVTPDLKDKLPPTDSRLRPDVRALEEGDVDLAEQEKVRVEEMQRERRRQGDERKPRWFKKVGEEWEYVGGYWEQRARGWKDVGPLW